MKPADDRPGRAAAQEFKGEVSAIAERIGVTVGQVQLRRMKRKIASCSSKGRLSFDPSILKRPLEEKRGIILHELLHIRYPNHGAMFKLMYKTYLTQLSR